MGKAEDNKRDKYERILAAARELFETKGYEGTTMEAVAAKAGVAKGSVFFHASSKAALLNQIFQIDMRGWVEDAFARPPEEDVLEDLIAKYADLMVANTRRRELSRVYMSHVVFALDERERMWETMALVLSLTEQVIDEAKAAGRIVAEAPAHDIASNLFAIYFMRQLVWAAGPEGEIDMDPREFLRPGFAAQIGPVLERKRATRLASDRGQ